MNFNQIFVPFFLLVFLCIWLCIRKKSTIEYNIENFLIVHNYVKRCFYKITTLFLDPKKSTNDCRIHMDRVDSCVIDLSKKFTKSLGKYVRGDELFHEMKQNLSSNTIDLFLFPDTFLQYTNIDFYQIMVVKVHEILEKDSPKLKFDNYKLLLESLST